MERGREGRRGGAGGGPVSAPRRPRTSGFKDATGRARCNLELKACVLILSRTPTPSVINFDCWEMSSIALILHKRN